MTRTELFKLRTHRTPWVLQTLLVISALIAPIYFAIKNPDDGAAVIETYVGVFGAIGSLLAVVFGGWIVGHEFRQGTLRRVLGNDARRGRLIATKAVVGIGALTFAMVIAAGIGALASVGSVASFDGTLEWDGVLRDLSGHGLQALVIAAVAFSLSILLRSDTYSMLGAIALMNIVGPLLTLIPKVGQYMPSALAGDITLWIGGVEEPNIAIIPASLGLTATIAVLAAGATVTFSRGDI